MPIYEYKCASCEETFEYSQRMADDPKTLCESCGGALERLISRTAFQLKGSGWYKDLYSSAKPSDTKSAASADSGASSKSSDASSSSSDASAKAPASSPSSESKSSSGGGKDT